MFLPFDCICKAASSIKKRRPFDESPKHQTNVKRKNSSQTPSKYPERNSVDLRSCLQAEAPTLLYEHLPIAIAGTRIILIAMTGSNDDIEPSRVEYLSTKCLDAWIMNALVGDLCCKTGEVATIVIDKEIILLSMSVDSHELKGCK